MFKSKGFDNILSTMYITGNITLDGGTTTEFACGGVIKDLHSADDAPTLASIVVSKTIRIGNIVDLDTVTVSGFLVSTVIRTDTLKITSTGTVHADTIYVDTLIIEPGGKINGNIIQGGFIDEAAPTV